MFVIVVCWSSDLNVLLPWLERRRSHRGEGKALRTVKFPCGDLRRYVRPIWSVLAKVWPNIVTTKRRLHSHNFHEKYWRQMPSSIFHFWDRHTLKSKLHIPKVLFTLAFYIIVRFRLGPGKLLLQNVRVSRRLMQSTFWFLSVPFVPTEAAAVS